MIQGLTAGSRVKASGRPVVVQGKFGLALDYDTHGTDQIPSFDVPWAVRLTGGSGILEGLTSGPIAVLGTWDGGGIKVEQVTASEEFEIRRESRSNTTPLDHAPPAVSPAFITAVNELKKSGLLATSSSFNSPPHRYLGMLCVYDVATAQREIGHKVPIENLQFIQCDWTAGQLMTARAIHEELSDDILCGFGETIVPHGQPRILLDVKYIPPELAVSLNTLPTGLLSAAPHISLAN